MEITVSPAFEEYAHLWACAERRKGSDAQFAKALDYYRLGTPEGQTEAFRLFKQAARRGFTEAMFAMGWCYEHGCGVKQNYQRAIRRYKQAQDQISSDIWNNPIPFPKKEAAEEPAMSEEEWAESIKRKLEEHRKNDTLEYDRNAALGGDTDAMMRLAWRYEYGRGAERDPSKAFAWYMQAARLGNNCAMERIAAMYESEEDYPLATKWYRRYAIAAIHERNEYLGW